MKIRTLKQALLMAQQIFKNKDQIKEVIIQSGEKANSNKKKLNGGILEDLRTFREMLKAALDGSYKFSKKTLIYIIAGLIYFISPIDLIPDFIIGLGFIDDAAVFALLIKRIKGELQKFRKHNAIQDVTIIS